MVQGRRISQEQAVSKLSAKFPHLDFSETVYVKSSETLHYRCRKHGPKKNAYHDLMKPKRKYGCKQCSEEDIGNKSRKPQQQAIEELQSVHPHLDFSQAIYRNREAELEFWCPTCRSSCTRSYERLMMGLGCKNCSQSSQEQFIKAVLDGNGVENVPQKRFDDCRHILPLPFDFWLPELELLVEFDGRAHREPIYGPDKLEETRRNDKIKDDYCEDNDIPLLRMSDEGFFCFNCPFMDQFYDMFESMMIAFWMEPDVEDGRLGAYKTKETKKAYEACVADLALYGKIDLSCAL